jgi:hypothetical protein
MWSDALTNLSNTHITIQCGTMKLEKHGRKQSNGSKMVEGNDLVPFKN